MATSSTNIIFDKVLSPMRSFMTAEFGGGMKVYISDEYKNVANLSLRLFCNRSDLIKEGNGFQEKAYHVDMCYYLLDANPTERTWEKIYKDVGRIEQVIFNNKNQSQPNGFINGRIQEIVVNSKTNNELNIDNLIKVYLSFKCNYVGNIN